MNSTQLAPDGRQSSRTSHSDDLPGDDSFELYPDDMLHRMFSMDTRDTGRGDTATGHTGGREVHSSLLGRMFDACAVRCPESIPESMHDTSPDVQSAVPTMTILETRNDAISELPLSSRMFDATTTEERNIINQYEFQSVIREIVSVRHSIRDHVIQLRQLRILHRKCEETLHEMLQHVKQDGVRSCDYPLLFYMSQRTKRSVNKQVHQSEQLQAFMKSRGIQMSDCERKDLICLIKKESYIKKTEGTIRSVPIDSR
jgi:hypothetical protein